MAVETLPRKTPKPRHFARYTWWLARQEREKAAKERKA
jgi:hypothetical protein